MKIKTIKIFKSFFIFCILIGGCTKIEHSSTDISVIPVSDGVGQYEILNISNYASSISYIPLETNDQVLIHEIRQILYEREKIVIHNEIPYNVSCMVFDDKGRYLYNLGSSGQGPEEYLSIRNISTDNDSIILYTTHPYKIRIYHSNGHLINILSLPDNIPSTFALYYIWFLQPQVYLADVVANAAPNSTSSYPRAMLLQEENNQLTIAKEYPYVNLKKESSGIIITYEVANMYSYNNQIRTYKTINDTIFTVGGPNLEMEKAFVFDLGKYRASAKWMFSMTGNNKEPAKYIWPLNIMESSNYLFIEFFFGIHAPEKFEYLRKWSDGAEKILTDFRVFGLFDKRTGQLKLMNQPVKKKLGFKNDIDGGPVIWPAYISTNDELVSFIHPEEFMKYFENIANPSAELKEIASRIEFDDNPIVIITKLK